MSSTDYTKLLARLLPDAGGEDTVRMRVGVVTAVNVNGTLNILLSGVSVPGVSRLDNVIVGVGDVVQIASYRGALLALGKSNPPNADGTRVGGAYRGSSTGNIGANTESLFLTSQDTSLANAPITFKANHAYRLDFISTVQTTGVTQQVIFRVRQSVDGSSLAGTQIRLIGKSIAFNGHTDNGDFSAQFIVGNADVTTYIVISVNVGAAGSIAISGGIGLTYFDIYDIGSAAFHPNRITIT